MKKPQSSLYSIQKQLDALATEWKKKSVKERQEPSKEERNGAIEKIGELIDPNNYGPEDIEEARQLLDWQLWMLCFFKDLHNKNICLVCNKKDVRLMNAHITPRQLFAVLESPSTEPEPKGYSRQGSSSPKPIPSKKLTSRMWCDDCENHQTKIETRVAQLIVTETKVPSCPVDSVRVNQSWLYTYAVLIAWRSMAAFMISSYNDPMHRHFQIFKDIVYSTREDHTSPVSSDTLCDVVTRHKELLPRVQVSFLPHEPYIDDFATPRLHRYLYGPDDARFVPYDGVMVYYISHFHYHFVVHFENVKFPNFLEVSPNEETMVIPPDVDRTTHLNNTLIGRKIGDASSRTEEDEERGKTRNNKISSAEGTMAKWICDADESLENFLKREK